MSARSTAVARAIDASRREAESLADLKRTSGTPVVCRPCAAVGRETPATGMLFGVAPVCEAHGDRYESIPDPRPVWMGTYCRRCNAKIMLDRDRQQREIALYGRLTHLCSGCFDEPASDSYLEGPSWRS